jgi:ligand-binding SRPBCC domain-containing protein
MYKLIQKQYTTSFMASHTIRAIQRIPASLQEVWDFFSDPANLRIITPAFMDMRVISHYHGKKIYAGQIIEYKVKPLPRIPFYWMTEITQVREKEFFADEQRKGPYTLWHHQHHFREIAGGVEMTDIVHYKNPLGFIGRAANTLFIRRQLQRLFAYRFRKTEELFGQWNIHPFELNIH